jgi:hypothetical protein
MYKCTGFSNILPLSYNFILIGCLSLLSWPVLSSY